MLEMTVKEWYQIIICRSGIYWGYNCVSTSQANKRRRNVLLLDLMIYSPGLHRKRLSPFYLHQYSYIHRNHIFSFKTP